MSLSTPRRPWALAVAGVAGWLVLTVAAALVDGESVLAVAGREGLGAAAAAALAVAAGGGLLGWWQHREWRRRTQWVAVDLLDRTMRRLANLAAATVDVADAAVPGTRSSVPLSQVFTLRWSPVKERAVHHEADTLASALVEWVLADPTGAGPTAAPQGVRAERTAVLQDRADALWDTAQELSGYLDDHHGPALLTAAGELHAAVRSIADPLPGDRVPGQAEPALWMLVATQLSRVVERTGAVARRLDDAYGVVRDHVTDDRLRTRLDEQERVAARDDGDLVRLLDAHEHASVQLAELDATVTDVLTDAQQIVDDCLAVLADPASDPEARRVAHETITQVRTVLEHSEQEMQAAARPPSDRPATDPADP